MYFLRITLVLPAISLLPHPGAAASAVTQVREELNPETSPEFLQRLGELMGVNDSIPCVQKRCVNTKSEPLYSYVRSLLMVQSAMKTDPVPDVEYLAQFAAATYCDSVTNPPRIPSIINCSSRVCPDLTENGVILLTRFSR